MQYKLPCESCDNLWPMSICIWTIIPLVLLGRSPIILSWGDLVALDTRYIKAEQKNSDEDPADFAASTTASLGIPYLFLRRGISPDDSPYAVFDHHKLGKGVMDEEEELLTVLKLSEHEMPTSVNKSPEQDMDGHNLPVSSNESAYLKSLEHVLPVETIESYGGAESQKKHQQEPFLFYNHCALSNSRTQVITNEGTSVKPDVIVEIGSVDVSAENDTARSDSIEQDPICGSETHMCKSEGNNEIEKQLTSGANMHVPEDNQSGHVSFDTAELSNLATSGFDADCFIGTRQTADVPDAFTSSGSDCEPIYEAQECVLVSSTATYKDQEPMYEGEAVLAEQVGTSTQDAHVASSEDEITPKEG